MYTTTMEKILVTDSLFIFDEHIKQLADAGYEVERLDTPIATSAQLIEALKGKVGYILGGLEMVTDEVLSSADSLRAIAFTGADYQAFIPGWKTAKEKGIMIADAPGANAYAVAEFALAAALSMQRNLYEIGRTGETKFESTRSFQGATIGVVGAGNIGSKIISMVNTFSPKEVLYYNRSKKDNTNATYSSLADVCAKSDVLFVAIPDSAGKVFDTETINSIKNDALFVCVSPAVIDYEPLLARLQAGSLRAIVDCPTPSKAFEKLPLSVWFNPNDHSAYNTVIANKIASDMSVQSIINLLKNGEDTYRVL
jgi:phosphoglycerate dehydrogenase-like enzyme